MAIPIVVENWCIAISCLGMVMIHGSVSTLFIQQLRSSPILCVDDTFKSFEKKSSTHMAFMGYFYSFIFMRVLCFFSKLDLYLARHTVDSPGFPTLLGCCLQHIIQPGSDVNPGPLLRQWCARHCGLAALCQQRQLRGGEARSIGFPMSTHFITWDSGWLKDDSPRTMGIWSSGLPELNRTGTEWNWKLVGTSKC